MSRFTLLAFLCLVLGCASARSLWAQDAKPLSAEQRREDLHYLARQMPLKHKDLFHTMTRAEFDSAIAQLDTDIPHLNEDQIFVRFAQIMAMVQDGHTGLSLRPVPSRDRKDHIPVRFDRYRDGIYVRAAAPEYAAVVGGKVLQVGSVDWKEAIRLLDSIVSHDAANDGEQFAWSARTELNQPSILHGLSLSDSAESADFVIEKDGERHVVTMKASVPLGEWYLDSVPSNWVDARASSASVPLSRRHEDQPFWFTELPEQHALYFQFNLVLNLGSETLDQFSKRLAVALAKPDVQRVVIDVRNNTGGDNTLLRPLLTTLIRSPQNHRGGIYVLTGPVTFSACQNFVNRLENFADVIFVGTPTGENVNFYGDPVSMTLPNSHLKAGASSLWWQDEDPRDKRTATSPELAVPTTFADYVAGRDPTLDVALTTTVPPTIEEVLEKNLAGGMDVATRAYDEFLKDPLHQYFPKPRVT